jgi:hypothetical protein
VEFQLTAVTLLRVDKLHHHTSSPLCYDSNLIVVSTGGRMYM